MTLASRLRELVSADGRAALRAAATTLGPGARVRGRAHLVSSGALHVGARLRLDSIPVPSHLVVGRGARVVLGDDVTIGHGAAISCEREITIGDGAVLGALVMLLDSDFHVAGAHEARPAPRPIHVGRGAHLGHGVILLPGARVGDGARVAAGSVVSGDVPPGARVSGNPAVPATPAALRVTAAGSPEAVVPAVVQELFGLAAAPRATDGPAEVPGWSSLGALRLLVALEERFAVTLSADAVAGALTVGALAAAVRRASEATPARAR